MYFGIKGIIEGNLALNFDTILEGSFEAKMTTLYASYLAAEIGDLAGDLRCSCAAMNKLLQQDNPPCGKAEAPKPADFRRFPRIDDSEPEDPLPDLDELIREARRQTA